ncbi:MAG: tetratricopeptide repeat protein [Planctomycetota bacterium]|nr:tetratricopeptide repeat protein [Planctomycetota bacterium]
MVVSSSYLRIHGLSLLIVLTMCTTVVVAQEEGRRFLKLGKSKKEGMVQSSIRIGKPETSGSKWFQPAQSAAQKFKKTFSSKPDFENSDPTSLSTPTRKIGPDIFIAAAAAQEQIGNTSKAISAYRQALEIAPQDRQATLGLARVLSRTGDSKEAILTYKKLLSSNPQDALVWNDLGLCYAQNKQMKLGVQALRKAAQEEPESILYRNNLATLLVRSRLVEEAFTELQAVHGTAVGHYNLAFLLQNEGDISTALTHTTKALQEDPSFAPAQELRKDLQRRINSPDPRKQEPARMASRSIAPVAWGTSEDIEELIPDELPASHGADFSPTLAADRKVTSGEPPLLPSISTQFPTVAPLPDMLPNMRHQEISVPAKAVIRPLAIPTAVQTARLERKEPTSRINAPVPESMLTP